MADQSVNRQAAGIQRVTRRQAAERLGISVTSIRRLEGTRLHPKRDAHGVWLFDAAEVEALAAQSLPARRHRRHYDAGEIASRVFRMFEEGYELADIVIELRQPPATVRALYDEWSQDLESGRLQRQMDEQEQEFARAMTPLFPSARGRR